jgi:hypothetical protein
MESLPWCKGSGHASLNDYYKKDVNILTDYYKWTFVRNPWDRAVSAHSKCTVAARYAPINPKWNDFETWLRAWYKHKNAIKGLDTMPTPCPRIKGFEDSMKVHFFPQSPLLKVDGEIKMDFIGRFESIEKDFQYVCNKLGVAGNLEHKNARKNPRPYQEYYTDELIEIVADLYEEDIVEFGYEFGK